VSEEKPAVRLSKDGDFAVCSTERCGVRFAEIERETHGILAAIRAVDYQDYQRRKGASPVAWLDFGPGWYQDREGVWRMDGRAWKNLSRGLGPKMRRAPRSDIGIRFDAAGNAMATRDRDRSYRPDSYLNKSMVSEFPVEIVCPACGRRQVATREGFTVS
jgi:hypothetical protein